MSSSHSNTSLFLNPQDLSYWGQGTVIIRDWMDRPQMDSDGSRPVYNLDRIKSIQDHPFAHGSDITFAWLISLLPVLTASWSPSPPSLSPVICRGGAEAVTAWQRGMWKTGISPKQELRYCKHQLRTQYIEAICNNPVTLKSTLRITKGNGTIG